MIKKTIKYNDYDNVQREEDFYFNLSRAEIIEMEYGVQGGLTKKLETIAKSNDPTQIIPMFKEIILKAYGKKSDDGKRFIKSPELSNEFSQTEAYSELVLELMSDADKASEFVNGLITGVTIDKDMLEKAKAGANISALPAAKS